MNARFGPGGRLRSTLSGLPDTAGGDIHYGDYLHLDVTIPNSGPGGGVHARRHD